MKFWKDAEGDCFKKTSFLSFDKFYIDKPNFDKVVPDLQLQARKLGKHPLHAGFFEFWDQQGIELNF